MKAEEIPAELLEILDRGLNMGGSDAAILAKILTAYEAMRPSYATLLCEWSDATGGDHLSLQDWAVLRLKLAEEEYTEWREALHHFVDTGDARPMAKESADLGYVIWGAAARPGIDMDIAFRLVHDSNMTKCMSGTKIRNDGKVLKGSHYIKPDMSAAVVVA